ncbi:restriction endonuclease subunit S [Bacillus cereus group sp. N8]|uniref:restriction endonuclease subunit S n=1 Tax=Bacillus cereus group sp. N8 TaxID=2794584 RepID=UPI0018F41176|nr:restriction endonuclease subunit S [Bacillus cereus group sp. N8]MBJ8104819.1 restriction endonuclease subunit S [Bacillus cereus group sp. N8]
MEYSEFSLNDLATFKYGKMPNSKNKVATGYPIYTGYKVSGYYSEYMYEEPMLIVVARGVGGTGDVKLAPAKSYITNLAIIIDLNEKICDKKFMQLYLHSLNLRYLDSGSAQSQITINDLKNLKVKIPKLGEQRKISNFIVLIERKLNLNSGLISKLEQLSQTIFKRWFIDFEFPNAEGKQYKSSGGEMVESELGEIPKGWTIDKLSNIAEIVMGQSPKSDTYNTENIGLPLLNGAADFKNRNLAPSKYTSDPKKIGKKGDFVFGVRATIGLITELDDSYAIGRGSGIARPLNSLYKEFLYEVLNSAFNAFQYTASGSVYLNISKNDLNDYKFVIPAINSIDKYHQTTEALLIQKENLIQENKSLQQLRDDLLPKLLSGEIELPDDLEVG